MNALLMTGLLALLLGATSIYLASPNQRWRAESLPVCSARIFGVILLIIGLVVLLKVLQPAAGAFVFVHWLMLLFVAFPYLGALLATHRETRK